MYKNKILLLSLLLILAAFSLVSAQMADVGISEGRAGGEVVSVTDGKIVVSTKDGTIEAVLSAATVFKKVSPENIKNILASSLSEISAGDKVLISGTVAADKKSMPARTIYLMTKTDIAQRHTAEAEQWRTRGLTGKVTAVNAAANQITVEVRGMTGATSIALTPKEKAKFRRYAENSVKFNEAKASSISEITAGDMIRALGDRGADGTTFTAEEVVTGAFQTVAGTVKAVDAVKNEVVITDIQSQKDVTIAIGASTTLKKFPEDMAQRMAGLQAGGAPGQGGGPRPPGATTTPQGGGQTPPANGTGPGPGGAGRGPGGGQRPGGIDDMMERFPNITVADLKAGDMIAVSSTKTANAERITAIKLVSGVEPFIRMAQMSNPGGGQRGGQGGVNGNFTIPGLDGFGGP